MSLDLANGLPGPLVLLAQLVALGALSGVAAATALEPWRARVASALGLGAERLCTKWLMSALAAAGAVTCLVHVAVAATLDHRVAALPIDPLVVGAGGGLIVAALVRGPALSRRECLVAGVVGAGITGLAAALASSPAAVATLLASAAIGSVLALGWPGLRVPVRAMVRRVTRSALRPAPAGLGATCLIGGLGATLLSGAVLTTRVPAPPVPVSVACALTALVALVAVWYPASRMVAVPSVTARRIEVSGYEITVLEVPARDPREGPPVFFVAGWSTGGDEPWEGALPAIARRTGRRLVALVLPSLAAGTDGLRPGPKLPQHRELVEAAIRTLSPEENVLLVGSSLGGFVTLTVAQDADAPIVAWLTIGTLGFEVSRVLRIIAQRTLHAPVAAIGPRTPKVLRRRIATWIRRQTNPAVEAQSLEVLLSEIGDPEELRRLLRQGPRLVKEAITRRVDPRSIRKPGHAVWGSDDALSPAANAGWLQRRRPDLYTTVLAGEGHSLHIESPASFAALLVRSPVFSIVD